MKFLVVLSVTVVCVIADVSHIVDYGAPIVKSTYDISPNGAYQYAYETGNGIFAQAQGAVNNPNSEKPALEVQGVYKYTAPDGSPVEISYIANELGYQPSGNVIPTPHPIPEAIARSLEYIRSHSSSIVQAANNAPGHASDGDGGGGYGGGISPALLASLVG